LTKTEKIGTGFDDVEKSPAEVARQLQEQVTAAVKGHYEMIYEVMATACEIALQFERKGKAWKKFEENDLVGIKFPHTPKQATKLTQVILFIFSGTSEVRYNRCIKYARGLQVLLDEGVETEDVAQAIKNRGGIEGLYETAKGKDTRKPVGKAATGTRKSRLKSTKDEEHEGDDDRWDDTDDNVNQDGGDSWGGTEQLPDEDSVKAALALIQAARKRGRHWLLLEAKQNKASEVLDADEGRRLRLLVQNRGRDENDLVTLRVVRVTAEEG